ERVAVQQHEGCVAEALDQRLEITGLHPRQEEVRVAEPGMHLHRQRRAGRLVRLERRRHRVTHGRAFDPSSGRRRITWPECFEVESAAVRGDRLQAYETVLAGGGDFSAQSVEAGLLGNALYAEHWTRGAVRRLAAQDAVRMVIDELDRVQYFEKWPCCSNASSPSE